MPPESDGSGQDRALLRKGSQILTDAGFVIKGGKRVDAKGEPLTVEFLIDEPIFEPHHMPFIKNLKTLGIEATIRQVDPVQYRARVDDFDFDVTVDRAGFSTTPGDRCAAISRRKRRRPREPTTSPASRTRRSTPSSRSSSPPTHGRNW